MKLMIASDIHGSSYWCSRMAEAFESEGADRLLLLGDLLYHGPRNDLPKDYAPKKVIEILLSMADKIICVRGNCEAEVDQMVLPFSVMSESALLFMDDKVLHATHGHKYNEDNPPPMAVGDILLCGHTHVSKCAEHGTFTYINPGSVSIPKENTPHSYMIFDGRTFYWKDLEDGNMYNIYTPCN